MTNASTAATAWYRYFEAHECSLTPSSRRAAQLNGARAELQTQGPALPQPTPSGSGATFEKEASWLKNRGDVPPFC
jgi:hypothetical protein